MAKTSTSQGPISKQSPVPPAAGDLVTCEGDRGTVLAVDDTHVTVQWSAGRRVQLPLATQGKRWHVVEKAAGGSAVLECSPEQRQALAEGFAAEHASYFTAITTLGGFERELGRLPDELRAAWAKLRAAAEELELMLGRYGATLASATEAEEAAAQADSE
jgi:hypothetical protein